MSKQQLVRSPFSKNDHLYFLNSCERRRKTLKYRYFCTSGILVVFCEFPWIICLVVVKIPYIKM